MIITQQCAVIVTRSKQGRCNVMKTEVTRVVLMYVRSIWQAFHVTKSFTVSMLDVTRSLNIDLFNLWFLYDWAVKTYNPFWLAGILQQCRCIKKTGAGRGNLQACKSRKRFTSKQDKKFQKNEHMCTNTEKANLHKSFWEEGPWASRTNLCM